MSALFGASTTGANLLLEMQTGSHERMLVTPLRRSALLLGRAAKEIVPVLVQADRDRRSSRSRSASTCTSPGPLLGIAIVAVFAVGLGSLSHALGPRRRKNQDWMFWAVQQTLLFPLLLLSGMLLPIEGGPGLAEVLSEINPLTYIVDAERALFAGELPADTVLAGIAAALIVLAAGLTIGLHAVRNDGK